MAPLERVLYVEDDADIQIVAGIALQDVGGLTVKLCSSGPQAVAEAPEFAPQMILLDVMMPGMDGPATLTALRKLPGLGRTPVVFMTAKVQSHEVDRYKAMGAVDVIPKPFDPMTLAARVQQIWKRAAGS